MMGKIYTKVQKETHMKESERDRVRKSVVETKQQGKAVLSK